LALLPAVCFWATENGHFRLASDPTRGEPALDNKSLLHFRTAFRAFVDIHRYCGYQLRAVHRQCKQRRRQRISAASSDLVEQFIDRQVLADQARCTAGQIC
jgi:hypothetical protein